MAGTGAGQGGSRSHCRRTACGAEPRPAHGHTAGARKGPCWLAATRVGQRLVVGGERGTILFERRRRPERWSAGPRAGAAEHHLAGVCQRARRLGLRGTSAALLRTAPTAAQSWVLALDGRAGGPGAAGRRHRRRSAAVGAAQSSTRAPTSPSSTWRWWTAGCSPWGLTAWRWRRPQRPQLPARWRPRLPNPRQFHLYGLRAAGSAPLRAVGEQGLLLRSTDAWRQFRGAALALQGQLLWRAAAGR